MRNQQLYLLLLLLSSSFSNAMSGSSSDPISEVVFHESSEYFLRNHFTLKYSITSDGEMMQKKFLKGLFFLKITYGNLNDEAFLNSVTMANKALIYKAITPEAIEKAANDYKKITEKNNESIIEANEAIAHTNWIQRGCLLGLLPAPIMPLWAVVPIGIYIIKRNTDDDSLERDYLYRQSLKNIVSEQEQKHYIETRRKDWDRLRDRMVINRHLDTYNASLEKRDLNLPDTVQNELRSFLNMPHHKIYDNPALSQPSEVMPT